jgi:hypothetical protein
MEAMVEAVRKNEPGEGKEREKGGRWSSEFKKDKARPKRTTLGLS